MSDNVALRLFAKERIPATISFVTHAPVIDMTGILNQLSSGSGSLKSLTHPLGHISLHVFDWILFSLQLVWDCSQPKHGSFPTLSVAAAGAAADALRSLGS